MSKQSKKNKPLEIDSEFSERNYTILGALFSGSVAYLVFASQSAYQEARWGKTALMQSM